MIGEYMCLFKWLQSRDKHFSHGTKCRNQKSEFLNTLLKKLDHWGQHVSTADRAFA